MQECFARIDLVATTLRKEVEGAADSLREAAEAEAAAVEGRVAAVELKAEASHEDLSARQTEVICSIRRPKGRRGSRSSGWRPPARVRRSEFAHFGADSHGGLERVFQGMEPITGHGESARSTVVPLLAAGSSGPTAGD
eukprot:1181881-Prorocentrum_minimum.AAC.3